MDYAKTNSPILYNYNRYYNIHLRKREKQKMFCLRAVGKFQEDLFHAFHVVVQKLLDAECLEEERYRCHAKTAGQRRPWVVNHEREAHLLFG